MTRPLGQLGTAYVPTSLYTDTSTGRDFYWDADPSTVSGVTVALNDRWFRVPNNAVPSPPPSPPTSYVPRSVPAYGTYKPDLSTAGIVTARDTLTPFNFPGNAPIYPVSGQVFESLEIFGDIRMNAGVNNVTFQNCLLRGPNIFRSGSGGYPNVDGAIFDLRASGNGWLIRDCTIMPQLPQYYRNGFIGRGFTAERVVTLWCNDNYGVYSTTANPLNTAIKGCVLMETVNWHGGTAQYAGQSTAAMTYALPGDDMSYSATATVAPYPLKADGTHNDGIQTQGGTGTNKKTGGTGAWYVGNNLILGDAEQLVPAGQSNAALHPLGYSDPWPTLGSQDSFLRYVYHTPSQTIQRLPDGNFPNGNAFVVQQNIAGQAFNNIDTLIIENNYISDYSIGFNIQANGGGYTTIQATFGRNYFTSSVYRYGSSTFPSIYPIRIDHRAGLNTPGLLNNQMWDGPMYGPLGPAGSFLYGPASGISDGTTPDRYTGIWYDGA